MLRSFSKSSRTTSEKINMSKTKPNIQTEALPVFVQLAALLTPEGLDMGHVQAAMGHRSPSVQQHLNNPFTVSDYDSLRPTEADPKGWDDIFNACDSWYQKNGLVRNIIDLMSDFCVAGIQVSSPDPKQQAFLRTWFKQVNGKHVSERIANMLYRLGNVGIRRQFAVIKKQTKEEWQKASAKLKQEIKVPENVTDERVLPMKYVTISPKHIKVPPPEVTAFMDEPCYYLKIVKDPLQSIQSTDRDFNEEDLVKRIKAKDIKEAWTTGKAVPLDNDRFKMLHYKKDDFDKRFAYPLLYAAHSDLMLYSKMMLADKSVVDSAIKRIIFVKVGDTKTGLVPPMEYIELMARQINEAAAGSKTHIVTQPFVDIVADNGSLATFLGESKFKTVLEAIYATFGVPSALTGSASGAAANNFMSMKVLVKKLEYVRDLLVRHWEEECQQVCAAGGYDDKVYITFTYQELGDESAIKKLIQDMYDRDVISDETYRYMMSVPHELEEHRVTKEWKERKKQSRPPKADPFHNANLDSEVKKIAVQAGTHSPEEVGTELFPAAPTSKNRLNMTTDNAIRQAKEQAKIDCDCATHQNKLDIEYENAKPQPTTTTETPDQKVTRKSGKKGGQKGAPKKAVKKQSGIPGQGRPKLKRDSTKRKPREYKAPRKT